MTESSHLLPVPRLLRYGSPLALSTAALPLAVYMRFRPLTVHLRFTPLTVYLRFALLTEDEVFLA